MEYLVLARKWRPQVFEDVLGQEHVVRTLKNAIAPGPHRPCLSLQRAAGGREDLGRQDPREGPELRTGADAHPLQPCVHCREITGGIAIDVREIDGASNRGIDEIRELRENVKFAPASCRYKVYIIDEVHMLTTPAFNALLKTLEEPPAPCDLHLRHDRDPQGPGDDPLPLPVLRLPEDPASVLSPTILRRSRRPRGSGSATQGLPGSPRRATEASATPRASSTRSSPTPASKSKTGRSRRFSAGRTGASFFSSPRRSLPGTRAAA